MKASETNERFEHFDGRNICRHMHPSCSHFTAEEQAIYDAEVKKARGRKHPRKPLFVCQECGHKFYSAASADRAAFGDSGCPGCGGSDIDVALPRPEPGCTLTIEQCATLKPASRLESPASIKAKIANSWEARDS